MIEQRKWGEILSFGPRQWLRHKLLFRELKRNLKQGLILDAGCGEGRLAKLIAKKGYQVFAFDESKESLKHALTGEKRVCLPKFWRGLMDQIPMPDNCFDAIISGDVLEHLPDDQSAVKEFFRLLKPGGIAIVSVPADPKKWSIDDDWSGHKRRYTKDGLDKLFTQIGFKTLKICHWGWSIIYIYYRLYYIPVLKKRLRHTPKKTVPAGLKESIALNAIFSLFLLPDLLLLPIPWGIGLIGIFQKPLA